jgi:hypothetical protein
MFPLSTLLLFNLYYFECMHDVIYEAESALCNINKHHLQLIIFLLSLFQSHMTSKVLKMY